MRDRQSRQSPHPRKQIKDLIAFINEWRSVTHDIMLNFDANEILGEESQWISKLMWECGLVDLVGATGVGPEEQLQDSYRQGGNCHIDFMLGSQQVHSSICQSGTLEYNNRILSDHWGLYVDLDPVTLFGGNTDDPVAASSHGFTSLQEWEKDKRVFESVGLVFHQWQCLWQDWETDSRLPKIDLSYAKKAVRRSQQWHYLQNAGSRKQGPALQDVQVWMVSGSQQSWVLCSLLASAVFTYEE